MLVLILGLVIFLGVHSVSIVAPGWRTATVARLGERPWKGLYSLASAAGLALIVVGYGLARRDPVVLYAPPAALRHLDLVPERRGMASSLQAFVGSSANGLVAGLIAPLVMHSAIALAATSLAMMSVGVIAWLVVKPHMRPAAALTLAQPNA